MTLGDATRRQRATVRPVSDLSIRLTTEPWPLAQRAPGEIAAHWARRTAKNPSFFDGEVLVLRSLGATPAGLAATMSRERFSSFLYWRDAPDRDPRIRDAFASAAVRSFDGHLLLGLTGGATLNAGLWNLPGGFLDARDVGADGSIDTTAAALRELAEEVGLEPSGLLPEPGCLVVETGPYVAFITLLTSPLDTERLEARARADLARTGDGELADLRLLGTASDLAGLPITPHALAVAHHLLGHPL